MLKSRLPGARLVRAAGARLLSEDASARLASSLPPPPQRPAEPSAVPASAHGGTAGTTGAAGAHRPEDAHAALSRGLTLSASARYTDALTEVRHAISVLSTASPAPPAQLRSAHNALGNLLSIRGDLVAARSSLQAALHVCESAPPDAAHASTANLSGVLNDLSAVAMTLGQYSEARERLTRAQQLVRREQQPDHYLLSCIKNNLGELCFLKGGFEGALIMYHRALDMLRLAPKPDVRDLVALRGNIGRVLAMQGKPRAAMRVLSAALQDYEAEYGQAPHPVYARTLSAVALAHCSSGKFELADRVLRVAHQVFLDTLGPDHPDIAACKNNMACLRTFPEVGSRVLGAVPAASLIAPRVLVAGGAAAGGGARGAHRALRALGHGGDRLHVSLAPPAHPAPDGGGAASGARAPGAAGGAVARGAVHAAAARLPRRAAGACCLARVHGVAVVASHLPPALQPVLPPCSSLLDELDAERHSPVSAHQLQVVDHNITAVHVRARRASEAVRPPPAAR